MHGWVGGVRGWLNTSQVGVGLVGTSASLSWLEPLAVRCWHAVWTHQVCRHTLPARFAALCVSVCVWMHVRAWLYSGTLWQIILCIYPHMHFPHWLTHEPSYRQYICALVWQASQTLPLSLTHECTHTVTALYVHSPPTMPSVWATLMWHFWQLGRLEMTALVHAQDIYTNTCRIPPPLCFTTYTKRLRVTDRSATLAVRGKKALRGGQGSRQVVFVPIEHTTLCATRPFYFSIRQSYRIQTFKKDLGR